MDTSWQLTWGGTSLLIDPWLVGSEIDGFSWFNEQWHTTAPVSIGSLSPYNAIVVSQSYSDHCHEKSLVALDLQQLIGTPKAAKRLRKSFSEEKILELPDLTAGWLKVGDLEVSCIDPGNIMDPVYYGLAIKKGAEVVVYFAHGFDLKGAQLELLQALNVKLLMASFSLYLLPKILGGAVNPGIENGTDLVEQLQPEHVVHTHDEQKSSYGLVGKLARKHYPEKDELAHRIGPSFTYLDETYAPFKIS